MVSYSYNTWGVLTGITGSAAQTIGRLNPLRYRGYVYDDETGLYYLQSRYYDPRIGRFINADGQMPSVGGDITGYNLFVYCGNDPVNNCDPEGKSVWNLLYHVFFGPVYLNVKIMISMNSCLENTNKAITNLKDDTSIIENQSESDYRFGLYGFKDKGCEVVATHNAKKCLRKTKVESSLAITYKDFLLVGATIGMGAFDSDPKNIGRVLDYEKISYKRINIEEIDKDGVYILSYWNSEDDIKKGLHTIAVERINGEYTTHNCSIQNFTPNCIKSRYICGYYLGE